jgi:dTDP-4-amino-4,6-dideoxygalactose transaminase
MTERKHIPFNWPYMTGKEVQYITEAHCNGQLAGDGPFTKRCQSWIEEHTGCAKALLTHSCTAALEMAALLCDLRPGDEVIMPSYTFVSTANAFVLRGAVPVFVDIRSDTLNINENLVESAITPHTRALVAVHYGGVSCEMDVLMDIATRHGLKVVEDAAQGFMATYKEQMLGSIGHLGSYSFHETKNITSGEGGCLLVNAPEYNLRAEVIREKGTDRSRYFRGEVEKYTWQDVGSSFLPGELIAAFLWAQFEKAEHITSARLRSWWQYHDLLERLETMGVLRRPIVPKHCRHNGHLYYVLLSPRIDRAVILKAFRTNDIVAVFHYVPLHSSPAGLRYGRSHGSLEVTDSVSVRLIRLPLWMGISLEQQERVVDVLSSALTQSRGSGA